MLTKQAQQGGGQWQIELLPKWRSISSKNQLATAQKILTAPIVFSLHSCLSVFNFCSITSIDHRFLPA